MWWQAQGYLTVQCPNCGISYSTAICDIDGRGNTYTGVSVPCATCGASCNVTDGIYSTVDGLLKRIADANPTAEEIGSLVAIFQAPIAADPFATRNAVEVEVPRLAPLLRDYWGLSPEQWLKWLSVFLNAIPALLVLTGHATAANASTVALAGANHVLKDKLRRHRDDDDHER